MEMVKGLSVSTAQASTQNLEASLLIKLQSNTLFTELVVTHYNELI